MRLGQNPLFRRAIVPWYDSEAVCVILILFLVVVFFFGLAGISVARGDIDYREHMWVAVLLTVLSGGVIVSITVRLIKRYVRHRISK